MSTSPGALLRATQDGSILRDRAFVSAATKAAQYGDVAALSALLADGASGHMVNAVIQLHAGEEYTVAHCAAALGQPHLLAWLHDCGCDLTAVNNHGRTPLHTAVRFDHAFGRRTFADMVVVLQDCLNIADRWGETPLPLTARILATDANERVKGASCFYVRVLLEYAQCGWRDGLFRRNKAGKSVLDYLRAVGRADLLDH